MNQLFEKFEKLGPVVFLLARGLSAICSYYTVPRNSLSFPSQ